MASMRRAYRLCASKVAAEAITSPYASYIHERFQVSGPLVENGLSIDGVK